MDEYEIARRASELPSRYESRLSPSAYKDVEINTRAGEWGEGLANLLAALQKTHAPITAAERANLAELMTAIGMSVERLDALTVHADNGQNEPAPLRSRPGE